LKAQVKGKFKNSTANYGPKIFEGSSKRFFLFFFGTVFFQKISISNQGFKKKLSVLSPEFYFTSWIFVKKNGTKAAVSRPYQGHIRAVPGPYQAQNLKFHIFSFCFIHDGFHFWF